MAISMKATWSTEVVDGEAGKRGVPVGEGRLQTMGANVAAGIGTDLSWIPGEAKQDGAAEGR